MMRALAISVLTLALAVSLVASAPARYAHAVRRSSDDGLRVITTEQPPPGSVAHAIFRDEVNEDGWGKLRVWTEPEAADLDQAYAAGYVEGWITSERMFQVFQNIPNSTLPAEVVDFVQENWKWMQQQVEQQLRSSSYWASVGQMMAQFDGMVDGYANATADNSTMTLSTLQLLQLTAGDDLGDLVGFLTERREHMLGERCSASVRWTDSDLFVAHDTWTEYFQALRIAKSYELRYSTAKAHSISFSSYPGCLFSDDDFYSTSAGLVVVETTGDLFNASLAQFIQPEATVLTWIRTMVSNRLAGSGKEWAETFSQYNSGTYNNAWLIVDYNQFERNSNKLNTGLFTLLEQLPGYCYYDDLTWLLEKQGFFASYNVWYFDEIFARSGEQQMVDQFGGNGTQLGDWFTYWYTPRALLFAKFLPSAYSLDHMQTIMLYQDYQHQPIQYGYPENGIAARSDLCNVTNPPFPALGSRCHGAIDSKITHADLVPSRSFHAYGAMTHETQPVFSWSTAPLACSPYKHIGLPDTYDFDWVFITPEW